MPEAEEDIDPINLFLTAFDAPDPLFTAEQVSWWPAGALDRLTALGLLAPGPIASHVVCTACGDRHVEQVTPRPYPDGSIHYFIPCPESIRVEVKTDEL